jgi:hypothetical protein
VADEHDGADDETESDRHPDDGSDTGYDTVPDDVLDAIDATNPDVIGTARRRYGAAGAALAAGMFALDVALGNKKKPESVQIQEALTEPIDVDKNGIQVMIDELTSVTTPALERREPVGLGKKRARHR